VKATNDFYAADANHPPPRVDGPPFDTATALRAGTASDTVIWSSPDAANDPARSTAAVRIDPALVVSYGTRADEEGIRSIVRNVAMLAAVQLGSGPNATAFNDALSTRVVTGLSGSPGTQSVVDIEADLAGAQTSMQTMKTRHQQTSATLTNMLQQLNGVSNEEVGALILALQTQMQASMQTTAMLLQTSLVNYLAGG
jgi:flagellin-like hook-associated protein FlgL